MISILFLLLTIVLHSNAAPLPLFTPFELNASSTGYIIHGTYCHNFDDICSPSILIIDTPNNRWLLDIGIFGKWISTPTAVHVINQFYHPGCFQMIGRTFTTEYLGYRLAGSLPDSNKPGKATYFGFIDVADGCGHPQGFTAETLNDIIIKAGWSTVVPGPFGPGGSPACFYYAANVDNNIGTIDKTSNRDAYFELPVECENPIPYCPGSYPPGNPCNIC